MIAADLFAQAFGMAVDRVVTAQQAEDGKANLQRAVESPRAIGLAVGILQASEPQSQHTRYSA